MKAPRKVPKAPKERLEIRDVVDIAMATRLGVVEHSFKMTNYLLHFEKVKKNK